MENEMLEILRALKSGQEYLIAKVDQIDLRLTRVEGEVKKIRKIQ